MLSISYTYDELLKLVSEAHEDLWKKLFPKVPEDKPFAFSVKRSVYTKAMKEVQEERGLKEGHPAFLMWTLYQIGHSPIIIEDGEDSE